MGSEDKPQLTKALVSVVIPTCRRPELLVRAIHSVLRQTCEQFEIVVVVDGPDEATFAALRTIGDERLRVVAPSKSVGGSDAHWALRVRPTAPTACGLR